jgi:hypothetical protein
MEIFWLELEGWRKESKVSPLIRTGFPTVFIGKNITLQRAKGENVTETKIVMEQKDVSEW